MTHTTTEITVGLYRMRNGMTASVFKIDDGGIRATFPVKGTVWRPYKDGRKPRALYAIWTIDGRHSTLGTDSWDLVERLPDKPKEDAAIALGDAETSSPIPDPTPNAIGPENA